jgi:hypothetical protein
MAKPYGSDARGRNKEALLAKLVAGPRLPVSGKIYGKGSYSRLCRLVNAIFQIGLSSADFKQRFDTSGVSRCLIPIKRIPGKAHDAAGFGDIAEFGGEIEKTGLVFDDVLIETFHGETPWAWRPVDGSFTLPSKRSSPSLSKGNCQIKSRLSQLKS